MDSKRGHCVSLLLAGVYQWFVVSDQMNSLGYRDISNVTGQTDMFLLYL